MPPKSASLAIVDEGDEGESDGSEEQFPTAQGAGKSIESEDDDDDDDDDDEDDASHENKESGDGPAQSIPMDSSQGDDTDPAKRLAKLLVLPPIIKPLGPVDILLKSANDEFKAGSLQTAVTIYLRAKALADKSGQAECHEHFITIALNLTETLLRLGDVERADLFLQPALLKLDSGTVSTLQSESAKRFLLFEAHAWWQSLFPEDKLASAKTSAKKKKTKKGKKKSLVKKA